MELTFLEISGCFFVAAEADVFGATVIADASIIAITNSLANMVFTVAVCLRLIMFFPLLFSFIFCYSLYSTVYNIPANNRF
jgi:hypothetical protein